MKHQRVQAGFTLIEVLVAFTILVAALPVLYAIFSDGLQATRLTEGYRQAVALGEARLAEIGVTEPLQHTEARVQHEGRFTWHLAIEDYQPWADIDANGLEVRAYAVRLDVEWQEHGRQRRVSLATVKLADSSRLDGS